MGQVNKIDRKNIEDVYALTPMQEGMLFHYLRDHAVEHYFEQLSLDISGPIDLKHFEDAWKLLVEKNEVLRTVFRWENVEHPVQVVLKTLPSRWQYFDFTGKSEKEKTQLLEEIKVNDRKQGFDLREACFRVTLCRLNVDLHQLVISNHHILYDGWSNGIILKELFQYYHTLRYQRQPVLPVKSRFKEFIDWLQSQDTREQGNFWGEYLAGFDGQSELSLKRENAGTIDTGNTYNISIDSALKGDIDGFSKAYHITPAALFYSAWGLLLHRYNNCRDLIFGITVSGRSAVINGIEGMVGLFINTLPFRWRAGDGNTVEEILQRTNNILGQQKRFEGTSLVDIREFGRLTGTGDLFDSLLIVENYPIDIRGVGGESGDINILSYTMFERTHYDLAVFFKVLSGIEIDFAYNPMLFTPGVIRQMGSHFMRVLRAILHSPAQEMAAIDILGKGEREDILYGFNRTDLPCAHDKVIQQLFEEQVERTPDAAALVCAPGCLSYRGLNKRANALARLLRQEGAIPDASVGIMCRRSLELLIAIMAVLKAGGAYLPIDPIYPEERIDYMLRHSGTEILITAFLSARPKEFPGEIIDLSNDDWGGEELKNPLNVNTADNLAYLVYTSGSTGIPKAVLVKHSGVNNFVQAIAGRIDFAPSKAILALTTVSFDIFVLETLLPLVKGLRVAMADEAVQKDGRLLAAFISRCGVDMIQATPSGVSMLIDRDLNRECWRHVKEVMIGGEPLPAALLTALKERTTARIYNMYGPTETTVWSAVRDLTGVDAVDIGSPIANTRIYILDRWGRPQPLLAPGELYIAGDGLARGYLNNPELTADKFVKNPIIPSFHHSTIPGLKRSGSPLYRTGDRARWLPTGNIEFIGRLDNQVKVRGFRIEPGEIESRLREYDGIKEAVVLAREDGVGDRYLCTYLVRAGDNGETPDSFRLREYLAKYLPGYMIPQHFVFIRELPLTPNGKIHRQALPMPEIKAGTAYVGPRDPVEERLVKTWSTLLAVPVEVIGIDDNFFRLGGHSLKVTRLASRVHKEFEVEIPLGEIFKVPTIRGLGEYIRGAKKRGYRSIETIELRDFYPLSSAQKRLFILNELQGIGTTYNMPTAIKIEGALERNKLDGLFRHLIQRHESLRTSFALIDGEPAQVIHQDVAHAVEFYDASRLNRDLFALVDDFVRPFDLEKAPLLRVRLLQMDTSGYILMFDMHHIVCDGISSVILLQEFSALYNGNPLPPLTVQYKDFSHWQNHRLAEGVFKAQEEYWQHSPLGGEIPRLTMPLDFPRSAHRTFAGKMINSSISSGHSAKLQTFASRHQVTANILLFAVYALLIGKYSGQTDIIIGLLAAGRRHPDAARVIGVFINFLPVRVRLDEDGDFLQFLQGVRKMVVGAYDNQDFPFERVVANVDAPVDFSRNPLFDTAFILHDELEGEFSPQLKGLKCSPYELENPAAALDFKVDIFREANGALRCRWGYNSKLFTPDTLQAVVDHFHHLLEMVLDDPARKLAAVELFPGEEKRRLQAKRNRLDDASPRRVKLVVCATFTADPIADYVTYWGKQFHLDITVELTAYNQVFQQLLDEGSPVSSNSGINVLLVRFEDWIRDFQGDDEKKCEKLEESFNEFLDILNKKNKSVPYFVGVFPVSSHLGFSGALTRYLDDLTARFLDVLDRMNNVYPLDFRKLDSLYHVTEMYDIHMDREAHLPFTKEYFAALGTFLGRKVCVFHHKPFKVIALDCDNTLWKGICGEDGALGVKVEPPFRQLQAFVEQKSREGMLLVLCSKNNEPDVWEVFTKNPGMILKREHLVEWNINWQPKSRNLVELADRLNVGPDSFIFIDDSAVECAEVKTNCPEVFTIQLPKDPERIPSLLNHIWAFDILRVTEEDRRRTDMYIAERRRQEMRGQVGSLEDFIRNLEVKVKMDVVQESQVPRVAQLTQRTNQFNLSTIRRSEAEIRQLMQTPGNRCFQVEVNDRFGDYGLVGVVIVKEGARSLFIDTFLLSCRVLGRNVENTILRELEKLYRHKGMANLEARFYPTQKNRPFFDFLERTGWELKEESEAYRLYTLSMECIEDGGMVDPSGESREKGKRRVEKEPSVGNPRPQVVGVDHLHRRFLKAARQDSAKKLLDLPIHRVNDYEVKRREYVAPRNQMEQKLQAIWESVLGLERPGVHDNFFDLGGNSLKAVMLNSRLKECFGNELSSILVYEYLTIAAQVDFLEGKLKGGDISINESDWSHLRNKAKLNRRRQKIKRGV